MVSMIIYTLLFLLGINGIILMGIWNNRKQNERLYKDAIRQLRVVAISRRR